MAKCIILLTLMLCSSCIQVTFALSTSFYIFANQSMKWTNNDSLLRTIRFLDGSLARFILLESDLPINLIYHLGIGCGFFCNQETSDSCYFAILTIDMYDGPCPDRKHQILWLANRDSPVGENAMLEFSQDEDVFLTDANGNKIWSTDTSGNGVTGMRLTTAGNLVLCNGTGGIVWQSFDNPTDTLLTGQVLKEPKRLTSSVSSTNWSSGIFHLSIYGDALQAFAETERPTTYLRFGPFGNFMDESLQLLHVQFNEASITFGYKTTAPHAELSYETPRLSTIQILRLDSDGGLRIYGWNLIAGWTLVYAFLGIYDECQFPLKCGKYGVCRQGQCTCPKGLDGVDYFRLVNSELPSQGCYDSAPSSLQNSPNHYQLVDFGNLFYFSYANSSQEECKQACLHNSSCKAAFFTFVNDVSEGMCHLPSEVLSIRGDPIPGHRYKSASFIKVKIPPSPPRKRASSSALLTHSIIISVVIFSVFSIICILLYWKNRGADCQGKHRLELVPEMPRRFSYKDLCFATGKFSVKLGEGGFGAVFKGELKDGTQIAVKRLDNTGQGLKEFLAEVQTLGNMDHINLVKLIGFCAKKSHKLLVYEYMSNGSLEKWIFLGHGKPGLDWKTRKKIILDVAKALEYLHEDCRQRIAHLDVKPHNILLDDNFYAKLSDFGLCKLIDRDESQVITGFRGTPGYQAPEWQQSRITVKADIYSFGVVLLEIVCGRKNFDYSQTESDVDLVLLLQRKAAENRLIDIVNKQSEDIICHGEEVLMTLRIGLWCLNDDYTRRPPMSTVIKVLEGVVELDPGVNERIAQVMTSPNSSSFGTPTLDAVVVSTVRDKISEILG